MFNVRSFLQHSLSYLVGIFTHWRLPWLKNLAIRWFVSYYQVDTNDVENFSSDLYPTFNAFFTRELKPGARPIDSSPHSIVSPVDGCVSECGNIQEEMLLQAKGKNYSVNGLLASTPNAKFFENGSFLTAYLAPKNYHRVHMPIRGKLLEMYHVPGDLFSVSQKTVAKIDNLFARNERVVFIFETKIGRMAYVMVGATLVGSVETVWHGVVKPEANFCEKWDYTDKNLYFEKGQEIGRFNMGSTVILLFPHQTMRWDKNVTPQHVLKMGEKIGALYSSIT